MNICIAIFRYETTATSLAFTAYLIAKHPEVQERLFAEIDEVIDDQVCNQLILYSGFQLKPPTLKCIHL